MGIRMFSWLLLLVCVAGPAVAQDSLTDLDATPPADAETGSEEGAEPELQNLNDMTIPELLDLAQKRFDDENFLLAKNLIRIILLRDETNIEASLLDAEMALVEGETDRARSRYRQVLAIDPFDFKANFGLGKLYSRTKLYRQARAYLERAEDRVEEESESELLTLLAKAYRGTGERAKALETAVRATEVTVGDLLPAWEYRVKLRAEGSDFDQALTDCDQLISLARREVIGAPSELEAIQRLYAAYTTQLEVLRSLHQSQYTLNADGSRSDTLQAGNEIDAAETLRRIVDVMVVQTELVRTMSYHSMLELADKAVDYDQSNLGLQMQHGLLLKNTSQFVEARAAFEKVLELDPSNTEAKRQLGSLPAAPISAPPTESTESASAGG